MDQNSDVIRHDIEETRSALTEKLETLENEVIGTVREATQAVTCTVENVKESFASTVENVKETVEETVQSVKQTFDLRRQVARHPWPMFGGSVAAGYFLGTLLPSDKTSRSFGSLAASSAVNYTAPPAPPAKEAPARTKPRTSLLSGLLEQLEPELRKVKQMAIGVTVGLLRDALKERIPESMAADFQELANNITTKIGGQPVHGPVLESADRCSDGSRHGV